ncbi:MAG: hypothetical protein AVDCRST_MAG33-2774 [uncultured Thermomicrobiales bacterium]|uniref:Pyridoxamine 5'-phosphate oxidase N-terminal domain-containing protein n=1 Tax=uncultured Thermomicrobiales bacterium TaxID=1645740 RepID=A0A6J4VDT9_9BACT|nr:MAG: hypothetical protein AVDCRST_MAG33-2774 [uncultured Thermomicrobiales bacterium]
MIINPTSELGAKVTRRVEEQTLAWLTTVASDGTPQPNPVWFLRDGDAFLIFSKPGQAKLANIARHPRVSLNLEATEDQEQITVFTGSAEVAGAASVGQDLLDRYAARYADRLPVIGMTRGQYEAAYTVVIRFTPDKLRGW